MTTSKPPEPPSEPPPAYIQGSCSICFEDLRQTDKISALVCGHVYHNRCISQWIAAKRQCPSCRRNVPKNGFVEKLFFDIQKFNGEVEKAPEIDFREEHYKLTATLKVEKENIGKLTTEKEALKSEVKSLEKKILKEKDKYRAEIPKLQAIINQLTVSSEETQYFKRTLEDARNRLKVSEFYKILTTHSDDAEKQIGEYLRKNGSLDTEKFFQLQKGQIRDLTEKRREAAREIESLKTENNSLKKKAREDAEVIKALKKSVLELRERANVETPINNKRLRAVLDAETPPAAKRVSLGFDDSSQYVNEELSFYKQKENKTPPAAPVVSNPSTSAPFNFDDYDEDDEYFRTPKLVPKKVVEVKKVQESTKDDSFECEIPIPQSIINRIKSKPNTNVVKVKPNIPKFTKEQPKPPNPPTTYSKKLHDLDVALPQSMLNRISAKTKSDIPKQSEKPKNTMEVVIKRCQSAVIEQKKTSTTSQKTARISSFFSRTKSSSSISIADECVTLD